MKKVFQSILSGFVVTTVLSLIIMAAGIVLAGFCQAMMFVTRWIVSLTGLPEDKVAMGVVWFSCVFVVTTLIILASKNTEPR